MTVMGERSGSDAQIAAYSPRSALKRTAEKVRAWPAYLRCHSSAYYRAKGERKC